MTRGDRLGHSWREGRLLFPGLASDFAAMIRAALALYEATGDRAYLDRALAWQTRFDRHYANPDTGGYFLTADDAEGLVVRPGSTSDDATPNPNSLAAQNLVRLARFDRRRRYARQGRPAVRRHPAARGATICSPTLRCSTPRYAAACRRDRRHRSGSGSLRRRRTEDIPFVERIVLRAPSADALPADHPAQAKIAAAPKDRGLRLRRRELFVASRANRNRS